MVGIFFAHHLILSDRSDCFGCSEALFDCYSSAFLVDLSSLNFQSA